MLLLAQNDGKSGCVSLDPSSGCTLLSVKSFPDIFTLPFVTGAVVFGVF